ncbi:MAG: RNA-binding protein [Dehalococcoidia bacterium]|nr:RNA-binding protein [Dehalococcoidia bacterium]
MGTPRLAAAPCVVPIGGAGLGSIYVGNLAHETTEADLRAAFSRFGEITSIKMVTDRRGRAKGFAYVEMSDEASTTAAMEALRGTQLHGRTMDTVLEEPRRNRGRRRR